MQTEEEKKVKVSKMRLLGYNRPEWPFLGLGIVCSAVLGLVMPIFALLLGSIIAVFFKTDLAEAKKVRRHLLLLCRCRVSVSDRGKASTALTRKLACPCLLACPCSQHTTQDCVWPSLLAGPGCNARAPTRMCHH